MMHIIKEYALSLLVTAAVVYLSLFYQSPDGGPDIPNLDKAVHMCMYFGMSVMLWFDYLRAHREGACSMRHGLALASAFPLIFGGIMELLQEYCTETRSGDWMDFAADGVGMLMATLFACLVMKRYLQKQA